MGAAFLLLGLSILLGASYPKNDEPIAIVEPQVKVVHFPAEEPVPLAANPVQAAKVEAPAKPHQEKTWATALWHATR
jgi:hypothetical protein